MKYEEEARKAAVAIHEENTEKFEAIMTDIITADVPPQVTDEHLERDAESRRKDLESLGDEEAIEKYRGGTFLEHLKEWLVQAKETMAALVGRSQAKGEALDQFSIEHRQYLMNAPMMWNDLFRGLVLGFLACSAVLADAHLLHGQISEWLWNEHAGNNQVIGHFLVSFLIVASLAIATHKAMSEQEPMPLRIGAGLFFLVFGVSLGALRGYSTAADNSLFNMLVGGIVWTLVSFSAPLFAAHCTMKAEPFIERCLDNLERRSRWKRNVREVRREMERAAEDVVSAKAELRSLLGEFPGARRAMIAEDEDYAARGRSARRWLRGMVASVGLSWLAFKREKPSRWNWQWIAKALGAVLLVGLALFLMGCAPPSDKPARQVNWVVVCDRSSSSTGKPACSEDRVGIACEKWAEQAAQGGGRIELLLMGQSISDVEVRTLAEHTGRFGPPVKRNRSNWVKSIPEKCKQTPLPNLSVASGVVEAVYVGVSRLRGASGDKTMILMSDMRQVTPGIWNFERKVPDFENFAGWLDSAGKIDAGDLNLAVCGFNTGTRESPVAMAEHIRLRELWEKVFREKWRFANTPMLSEECRLEGF